MAKVANVTIRRTRAMASACFISEHKAAEDALPAILTWPSANQTKSKFLGQSMLCADADRYG